MDMKIQSYSSLASTIDAYHLSKAKDKLPAFEKACEEITRRYMDGQVICERCSGRGWLGFRKDDIEDDLCIDCDGTGMVKNEKA